jgi:hypothetical protein
MPGDVLTQRGRPTLSDRPQVGQNRLAFRSHCEPLVPARSYHKFPGRKDIAARTHGDGRRTSALVNDDTDFDPPQDDMQRRPGHEHVRRPYTTKTRKTVS